MASLRMRPTWLLVPLVASFALLLLVRLEQAGAAVGKRRLPPIWSQGTLEDEDESLGTYRILSEVHLDDTSSYLVEEWLDGPNKQFRMDVLPEHADSRAAARPTKKSFLVNGGSQERFFFEPFRCLNLNRGSLDANLQATGLASLFQVFPARSLNQNALVFGGVGSIWQEALNSGGEPSFKPARVQAPVAGRRRPRSKFEVLRALNRFLTDASQGFPFKAEFYFVGGSGASTNSSEDDDQFLPQDLVAIHLVEPNFMKTKLTARIIEISVGLSSVQMSTSSSNSKGLFELPLGYGCSRREPDHMAEYKPPRNCFHTLKAHTCYMETATWLPLNELDGDIDLWQHHTMSMRIVSGSLLGREYLTIEESDFAPILDEPELNLDTLEIDPSPTTTTTTSSPLTRGIALRRAKRVWDLSQTSANSNKSKLASDQQSADTGSMYFALTDHLRSCAATDNAALGDLPNIEFPLFLPSVERADNDRAVGDRQARSSDETTAEGQPVTSRMVGLSLIDRQMSAELFEHQDGYKLVRKTSETWLKYQTIHQEKRVDKFEFRDRTGRVVWTGPVSLIRKFSYIDSIHSGPVNADVPLDRTHTSQPDIPAEASRVQLTIIPYTSKLDRQLGRIELTMLPGFLVDEAYLHRELDIAPCLQPKPEAFHDSDSPPKQSPWSVYQDWHSKAAEANLDFKLVYPLEEPFPSRSSASIRSQVYSEILRRLCSARLLQSDSSALNPMQITRLQVDVEPELVRITGSLNKWPETFNYVKYPNARPVASSHLKVFLREAKPNVELCAESCSHYECPVFAYDLMSNLCELYEKTGADRSTFGYLGDYLSAAYERKSDPTPSADPELVLRRMRELLPAGSGDDWTNELAIGINDNVTLLPSSLLIGNEPWIQDQIMLNGALTADGTSTAGTQLELASSDRRRVDLKVDIEFAYFAKNKKFSQAHMHDSAAFPVAEINHVSRQECQQVCLENDCRSYSFCNFDSTCIVSKLIRSDAIQEAIVSEDFCNVMVVDQFSKFQATSRKLVAQATLSRVTSERKASDQILLEFETVRDCAESCLNFQDFTCKSFFFCPLGDDQKKSGKCFLFGIRQSAMALLGPRLLKPGASSPPNSSTDAPASPSCDYYQRSYLADYHQFHGKRLLELGPTPGKSVEVLIGLSAEECANECSRLLGDGTGVDQQQASSCRAFHVCLGSFQDNSLKTSSHRKRRQLLCGLLVEDANSLSYSSAPKTTDLMTDASKCTTFFRADRIGTNPTASEMAESPAATTETGASGDGRSLLQSAAFVVVGLGVGYWSSWLVAWRTGNVAN